MSLHILTYGDWDRDFDLLIFGCGDSSDDPRSSNGNGDFSCFCTGISGDTEILGDNVSFFEDSKYSLDNGACSGIAFVGDWSSEDGDSFFNDGDLFGE